MLCVWTDMRVETDNLVELIYRYKCGKTATAEDEAGTTPDNRGNSQQKPIKDSRDKTLKSFGRPNRRL